MDAGVSGFRLEIEAEMDRVSSITNRARKMYLDPRTGQERAWFDIYRYVETHRRVGRLFEREAKLHAALLSMRKAPDFPVSVDLPK